MSQFVPVFFCVILFIGNQYSAGQEIAGYEYKTTAKAWLRLHIIPATWRAARQRCHLEGGVLVSPTTLTLKEAIMSMMKTELGEDAVVYTGIYGGISKGDFASIEGVALADTTLQWAEDEPSNDNNNEDCIVMHRDGKVADSNCTRVLPYFCRKETQEFKGKCNSTDAEYKQNSVTDRCYRFHRVARTWHNAAKACSSTQGHLVIINSNKEAKIIKDIFAENPANTIVGATNPNYAFVGFWTWYDKDGEWLTIHGQTLAEAGYEIWKKGEPNNYMGAGEFCGAVWRHGGFNDVTCNHHRYPFICETAATNETPSTKEEETAEEETKEEETKEEESKEEKNGRKRGTKLNTPPPDLDSELVLPPINV